MKLTNCRFVGRYINPATGRAVNIHKGRQVGRSCDHYYYLLRQGRIYVPQSELYSKWKREQPIP